MSQFDFNTGRFAESWQSAAQEQIDNDSIAKWQSFSNRLQKHLSEAQSDAIHREAALAARDAQQQVLRDVLSEIAPNHPILKRIKEVGEAAQIASYRANGYQFDLVTKKARKI